MEEVVKAAEDPRDQYMQDCLSLGASLVYHFLALLTIGYGSDMEEAVRCNTACIDLSLLQILLVPPHLCCIPLQVKEGTSELLGY